MTWQDLTLFTWVPAVAVTIWHVRQIYRYHNNFVNNVAIEYADIHNEIGKLETSQSRLLADIDRIDTKLNAKAEPKLCRHEFQLIGSNDLHVSTYRCYSCHNVERIDHRFELAKRYPKKSDQA